MLSPPAGLVGVALLVPSMLFVPALLRVRGTAAFFLAALTVASTVIVLSAIALTPLEALTGWGFLGGEAVAAVGSSAAWLLGGRPRPETPSLPSLRTIAAAARSHPAAFALASIAGLALLLQLVMAIAVTPNNWDSMTYHLARAAYWLQFDSLAHFAGGNLRQLANPPNGEILHAWTLAVTGTDRFANLVQWLALVGLAVAIYSGARLIGFGRPAALFAASLFVVLPQPIMQATTTQNDLTGSLFLATALLLAVRGLRDRDAGDLAVAGAALGLAVGTKGTTFFAVPSLGLLLAAVLVGTRPPLKLVALGAGFAAAGVLALGSFNYALNAGTYGDPLGHLADYSGSRKSSVQGNLLRVAWSFVETPGMTVPWLSLGVDRPAYALLRDQHTKTFPGYAPATIVQEDEVAYGLIGFLVLPALILVALLQRRSRPWRLLAGAAVLYLLVFAVFKEQDPWVGRLLLPMVVLAAPLFALLYHWAWLRVLTVALAVASLAPSVLTNPQKPLLVPRGSPTAFGLGRVQQQALIRPEMATVIAVLSRFVDGDDPVGLVRSGDSWDYSFFGEHLRRRVEPLEPEQPTPQLMRARGLAGIVYANVARPRLPAHQLAPGYWFVTPPGR
jgi:Dolichyl-phosphate-mannose-protein mannosyltransferase